MVDAIRAENLSKTFGQTRAVQDLNLRVEQGEIYGLLGLNGAGKTTTVRMLSTALPPTSGSASVRGADISEASERIAEDIGVVFGENITPEPSFSPVRYLRYFGGLYGLSRETVDERIQYLVDLLDLTPYAERPIRELSGGNKRKVEIARALLHGPRILFLDEPTRELDIPSKREMWSFFRQLAENKNVTVFLSSHDVQEIGTLCTRIGILHEGVKTWEGTTHDLPRGRDGMMEALSQKLQGETVIDAR